jgi:hypothetical protein
MRMFTPSSLISTSALSVSLDLTIWVGVDGGALEISTGETFSSMEDTARISHGCTGALTCGRGRSSATDLLSKADDAVIVPSESSQARI